MKKSSVWLLVPLFIAFQLITSCSSTQLVSSWRDPETTVDKTKLSKVLVMCLVKDETTRRVAEDEIVKRNPTVFVTSYDKYPAQMLESNPDKMKVEIPSQGYDGIIIMRLVGKEQATTYVPGSYPSYYGGWYGYYGYAAPYYYDPGYYRTDEYYSVETNIYSIPNNKLIWSGITETINPGSVETTIREISDAIAYQMKKEGFLKSEESK